MRKRPRLNRRALEAVFFEAQIASSLWADLGELMVLPNNPYVHDRIQLRRVARQQFFMNPAALVSSPASAERCFQLKQYRSTEVCPRGTPGVHEMRPLAQAAFGCLQLHFRRDDSLALAGTTPNALQRLRVAQPM